MPQVTDEELRKEIEKILEKADLSKTSTNKVIKKLEEVFDMDLASKKMTIDKIVLDFVNSQPSSDEEDGDDDENDDDDDDEDEKEKRKPPKRAAKTVKPAKKPRKEVNKRRKRGSSEEDDSNDSEFEEKVKETKKSKSKGGKGGRGKGSGYTRAYKLSPALSDLMGAEEMPRHEVVKRMWALIKEKQLYDPNNKQFAICDEGLYKVIGTKRFRIFGMMKYLKTHFIDE